MNIKDKKLLIFDLDGTLINSVPDIAQAVNKMLESLKLKPIPLDIVQGFIGNGAKTLIHRCLDHSNKNNISEDFFAEAFTKFMDAYKANPCDKTILYPGVNETLEYLKEENYKMVICTNKPNVFVDPILNKLEIKKYFDSWIGESSLDEKKPSGMPLIHLAKESELPIDKCLMIGDSKNDIMAASNAKMESVGVSYGYNYNEDITKYNPTVVLNDFTHLKELL